MQLGGDQGIIHKVYEGLVAVMKVGLIEGKGWQ